METKSNIQKSISYGQLEELANTFGIEQDLFKIFDQFPIKEIRRICIKAINDRRSININDIAEWLEHRITILLLKRDDLWEDLLEIYLFKSEDEELLIKAVEFAVNLGKKDHGYVLLNTVAKLITGKIKSQPELYFKVPSICLLLDAMLNEINGIGHKSQYYKSGWVQAERAITMILLANDRRYLPQLKTIKQKIDTGFLQPDEDCGIFAVKIHGAFLTGAAKMLKKRTKK